ncbi:Ubiquinone/menaquinone biosynthesis C-methylase UbiE [Paenibacillus sp. UNCCL117]|uniref:class I SAM-dependent methyltransferase n=1 Tax=unclassified Paenibacillus TaxID=185978 RepID=UPI00088D9F2B|nr:MULTISPECIES: class I SAM-dependent methyltransferase [unclassified Paenibacillus]SDC04636.1 Ubiquinone/menaquinone biosynthesis C-methylase UbiE [Paenibacillus sp. cl123]SFW37372.1 Ubiquinone/menaquinone biosynthesis C-methylase UbiE [Paenibacillus sp. UNCCL117]
MSNNPIPAQQWNAQHYDQQIHFVSELGKGVVALLDPQPGERILDLGCGTGDLAEEISRSGAECAGIDYSQEMIDQAKVKYPKLTFRQADGEAFRLQPGEQPYDAVFSNAALHWMKRPERVAESVWLALKPGGRFVAEFGGSGNVQTIVQAICQEVEAYGIDWRARYPWYFPTIGEYASVLERQGFEVGYAQLYDRPTRLSDGEQGMRHWLNAFAGVFLEGLGPKNREEVIERCIRTMRPTLHNGEYWEADYRRIRIQAIKRA